MTYDASTSVGRSTRASALGGTYAHAENVSARIRFRRGLILTLMSIFLPGSAQIVGGNKRVGIIALRVWFSLIALALAAAALATVTSRGLLALATSPVVITAVTWILVAVAIAWTALLVDAWRLGRPLTMARSHRLWMTGLNVVLCFVVAGSTLFAAQTVYAGGRALNAVFASDTVSNADQGRYNVLLLGGDSGPDRSGVRPDSLTVASIDAATGKTVLIGVPRNLEDVPFPAGSTMDKQFPNGFNCDDCYLNGVNTWANDNAELFAAEFKGIERPGIAVTKQAVEEVTGLKINYAAMINMDGFSKLIDAVGGITVTVQERTAIGGIGSPISGYIEPGRRKLNGTQALWYGRSRVLNDDFSRMGRQKCLLNAMVRELNPQVVLTKAQKIADSSAQMLTTDVPRQEVSRFLDLGLKAKSQTMSSVSLVPPAVYPGSPDYDKVRSIIKKKIDRSEGKVAPKNGGINRARLTIPEVKDPAKPTLTDPRRVNQSDDVSASC